MANAETADRKQFLTAAVAGAAATLGVQSVISPPAARADTGDDLVLGEHNEAGSETQLVQTANPYRGSGLYVQTSGQGPAMFGDNATGGGPGVAGDSGTGTGPINPGVFGKAFADRGVGVSGMGDVGVQGDSPGSTSTQIGVKGSAEGPNGVGVHGTGFKGVEGVSGNYGVYGAGFFGVYGLSPVGAGVYGDSTAHAVPGVLANNQLAGGVALNVQGMPKFSSAGRTTIPPGAVRASVQLPGVVAADTVLATVQTHGSVSVKYASASTGKITIVITATATAPTTVGYFVIRT